MEREEDRNGTVIELGTASTETLGALGEIVEPMGLWHKTGISDE